MFARKTIVGIIDWDGSYTQTYYHSGKTDCNFGHHDYQNASGLGLYHWHHGEGPHLHPHIAEGKSLIDLFKSYNGSACTTIKSSSGAVTYIFEGIIELEKDERYFTLEINGLNDSFYLISDKKKEAVESFLGTDLNPMYVKRDDSPWSEATGGFDILVNAEYFKALVKKYCGLEEPGNYYFDEEMYENNSWYKTHADYIFQIEPIGTELDDRLNEIKQAYDKNISVYREIAAQSGIPQELIAAIHYREKASDFLNGNFDVYLHNGQELGSVTTIVPIGKDFKKGQFKEAALDALKGDYDTETKRFYLEVRRDQLKLNSDSKDIIAMIAFAVFYNGTGGSLDGKNQLCL